jgi:hypothetical protein
MDVIAQHPYPFPKLCLVHNELGLLSRNDGAVERQSWEQDGDKLIDSSFGLAWQ